MTFRRIAIVDDNLICQKVLSATLNRFLPPNVAEHDLFENGARCLDALATKKYDLVLMDIEMPILDGLQTTLQIRNPPSSSSPMLAQNHDIPIVAVTSNDIHTLGPYYRSLGINEVFQKPFEGNIFENTIMSILCTKLGPLIQEHDTLVSNLTSGFENSIDAALDLEEAYVALGLDSPLEVEALEDSLKSYHCSQHSIRLQQSILKDMQRQPPPNDSDLLKVFETRFTHEWKIFEALPDDQKYRDCQALEEYYDRIYELRHPGEQRVRDNAQEDEDLQVVSQKESFDCPLTLALFENPVKSRKCHHVFSKTAILNHISRNRGSGAECPKAGCPHFISINDLVPDKRMERLVAAEKRRRVAEARADVDDYMEL